MSSALRVRAQAHCTIRYWMLGMVLLGGGLIRPSGAISAEPQIVNPESSRDHIVISARTGLPWTWITPDFQQQAVMIQSIDQHGITLKTPTGDILHPAWDQVVELRSANTSNPTAYVCVLRDGQRIGGMPIQIQDESLYVQTPFLGSILIPLSQLDGFGPAADPGVAPADRTQDMIRLKNGDVVRGVLSNIVPGADNVPLPGASATPIPGAHESKLYPHLVKLQDDAGKTTDVPMDAIRFIYLAQTAEPKPLAATHRVTFCDGSVLNVSQLTSHVPGQIAMHILGQPAETSVSLNLMQAIEPIDGPAKWLNRLWPQSDQQVPYLGVAFPTQTDRSADGLPLLLNGKPVAHGLGVHSHSTLVYSIDAKYTAFRAQYAIASRFPMANVTVRIRLDDRLVYEKEDVTSKLPAQTILLPLDGAKTLTLEVDYGKNLDVQDSLDWIEPALLKQLPPPAPASAPASTQPATLPTVQ